MLGMTEYKVLEKQQLKTNNIAISVRTIERFLTSAGFPKLHRRSYQKIGISRKRSIIPARSQNIDTARPELFRAKCQIAGAFFFLPYILESGIYGYCRIGGNTIFPLSHLPLILTS
ncbi:hypothetical protein B9J78_03105 [bacterium Unc6]|nr:hypothetical protein [bacterium Unc6]